jgi:hypothetical protein
MAKKKRSFECHNNNNNTKRSRRSSHNQPTNALRQANNNNKLVSSSSSTLSISSLSREQQRSAILTRDSKEKHQQVKLRLHMKRIQRQLHQLRCRLEAWDDNIIKEKNQKEINDKEINDNDDDGKRPSQNDTKTTATSTSTTIINTTHQGSSCGPPPPPPPRRRKKGRLGPETWKLKGAARPAWQVYDFDTRHVDPYQQAHYQAAQRIARSRNIMVLCQGRFGHEQDKDVPQPYCRQYLALLMQLGLLAIQSKQLFNNNNNNNSNSNNNKTARQAFTECMDLDSTDHPITLARCYLMRMYMQDAIIHHHHQQQQQEEQPPPPLESVRHLYQQRLSPNDPSVWIRYSAVLMEYIRWKKQQNKKEENDSTQTTAERWLARAMRYNIFCAYYLAFWETFDQVMEHTDEIEDANDSSPLEEAIEYCNSEQLRNWKGTDGAREWILQVIMRVLNGGSVGTDDDKVTALDLDWRVKLDHIHNNTCSSVDKNIMGHVSSWEEDKISYTRGNDNNDDDNNDDEESMVDLAMFATMFETAMEMLEASGQIRKAKSK